MGVDRLTILTRPREVDTDLAYGSLPDVCVVVEPMGLFGYN
jgi:hypothetical protein